MSHPARIGLYGGTFDPIHNGHLHLIAQLLERHLVDELILIPAGQPWLRANSPMASGVDRLAMAQLAVKDLPPEIQSQVSVSDIEVQRSGPTYTIDTVEQLQKARPDVRWVLILGSDAHQAMGQWHRSEELQSLVEILIVARDGHGLDIQALPISATDLRASLQSQPSQQHELPESVWTYIKEHKLYASK
ncbi:MAG TPA: nicotinate (nicotinamide) nucleotide adenylyltransferase [Candidatus Nanopelagicaceae bacterium]